MHRYTTGPSKTRGYPAAHIPALSRVCSIALPVSIHVGKVLKNPGQENGVMRGEHEGAYDTREEDASTARNQQNQGRLTVRHCGGRRALAAFTGRAWVDEWASLLSIRQPSFLR